MSTYELSLVLRPKLKGIFNHLNHLDKSEMGVKHAFPLPNPYPLHIDFHLHAHMSNICYIHKY